eukprot:gene3557-2242_t
MGVLKPIYKRLSKDSVLEGCFGGYTQNSCEPLNHLIWARCPKTMASGKVHLDCAAVVIVFYSGNMAMCGVLEELVIEPGRHTAHIYKSFTEKDTHTKASQKKNKREQCQCNKKVIKNQKVEKDSCKSCR